MDVAVSILGDADPNGFPIQFLVALMIATSILILSARHRMRKSQSAPRISQHRSSRRHRAPRSRNIQERAELLRTRNAADADSGAAMLEFQEYARTIQAQIDNRYQKLEAATAQADQKIAELRQLLAQSGITTSHDTPVVDRNLDVWHTIATPRTQR
jgi:seryl-tRNA synthetase